MGVATGTVATFITRVKVASAKRRIGSRRVCPLPRYPATLCGYAL